MYSCHFAVKARTAVPSSTAQLRACSCVFMTSWAHRRSGVRNVDDHGPDEGGNPALDEYDVDYESFAGAPAGGDNYDAFFTFRAFPDGANATTFIKQLKDRGKWNGTHSMLDFGQQLSRLPAAEWCLGSRKPLHCSVQSVFATFVLLVSDFDARQMCLAHCC